MSVWTLVLADLKGNPIGELNNVYGRSFVFGLNTTTTGSFRMRADHPLCNDVMQGDVLVKLYRDTTLTEMFDLATMEEVAEGTSQDGIAVNVAGVAHRLGPDPDHPGRLCGKSTTFGFFTIGATTGYTRTGDRGQTAADLINKANAEQDTGIRVGVIYNSASDTVGPWYFKPILEAIGEMSAVLDGFDWQVVPLEPLSNAGKVGEFQAGPVLGVLNDGVIFEFGTGRHNIKSYRHPVDRTGMLNRAFALPSTWPPSTSDQNPQYPVSSEDKDSEKARGLRETVVSSDIDDPQLRSFLCQEQVRVRRFQREQIIFEPHIPDPSMPGRVPEFKQDYDVGDIVRARAVTQGQQRFDALFRIYGVQIDLSEVGEPTVTLTLIPTESPSP